MSAPVINLDEYRRDESSGMYVPAATEPADVEPVEVEVDQAVDEEVLASVPQQVSTPAEQGHTKTVKERERELAEARRLVELQGQDVTAEVDTARVRKAKKHGAQARKLHALRQRPETLALRDARVRLWTTVMAMAAAVAALGWSTASVQQTAAHGAPAGTAASLLAYLVEPLISVGLLAVIAVQAYAAMRGATVDPGTEHGRTLRSTQRWLLTLTVTLNVWPYIAPLWSGGGFDLIQVVIHLVGPIVAVRMIHSLPAMWAVIEGLQLPTTRGVTPPACSKNAVTDEAASKGSDGPSRATQIRSELAELIAAGRWTKNISVPAIREHFECGTDLARDLRDEFKPATTQ